MGAGTDTPVWDVGVASGSLNHSGTTLASVGRCVSHTGWISVALLAYSKKSINTHSRKRITLSLEDEKDFNG